MHSTNRKLCPAVTLANSGTTYVYDSTSTHETGYTAAPGTQRGKRVGYALKGSIKVGNQAVTLKFQMLSGNAGTSADWEDESGGAIALTASTTYPFVWRPQGTDYRCIIVNGGTGPDALVVSVALIPLEEVES